MPLFLEPGQRYPVVLDSDADKPKAEQPTFFAKSQSMRGQQKVAETLDLYHTNPDITPDQLYSETVEVLGGVFIGWSNMGGIEFGKDALRDLLTYQEARELLRKVMFNQHITTDEKKSTE